MLTLTFQDSSTKKFDNFTELVDWWEVECAPMYNTMMGLQHSLTNVYRQHSDNIRAALKSLKAIDSPSREQQLRVVHMMQQFFGQLLIPGTAGYALIEELYDEDAGRAAAAACVFWNQTLDHLENPEVLRGALAASAFRMDADAFRRLSGKEIQQLRQEWLASLSEVKNQSEDLTQELGQAIENAGSAETGAVNRLDRLQQLFGRVGTRLRDKAKAMERDFLEQFQAKLLAADEQLEDHRQTFKTELALRAPATYWDSKAGRHRVNAWIWGGVTVIATVCVCYALAGPLPSFVSELISGRGTAAMDTDTTSKLAGVSSIEPGEEPRHLGLFSQTPFLALTIVTLYAAVVFAVLRFLVKNLAAQIHLATDAAERVVMVKTYLALQESDQVSAGDMQIVLERLFRPSSDGIVKDDTGPSFLPGDLFRRSSSS